MSGVAAVARRTTASGVGVLATPWPARTARASTTAEQYRPPEPPAGIVHPSALRCGSSPSGGLIAGDYPGIDMCCVKAGLAGQAFGEQIAQQPGGCPCLAGTPSRSSPAAPSRRARSAEAAGQNHGGSVHPLAGPHTASDRLEVATPAWAHTAAHCCVGLVQVTPYRPSRRQAPQQLRQRGPVGRLHRRRPAAAVGRDVPGRRQPGQLGRRPHGGDLHVVVLERAVDHPDVFGLHKARWRTLCQPARRAPGPQQRRPAQQSGTGATEASSSDRHPDSGSVSNAAGSTLLAPRISIPKTEFVASRSTLMAAPSSSTSQNLVRATERAGPLGTT